MPNTAWSARLFTLHFIRLHFRTTPPAINAHYFIVFHDGLTARAQVRCRGTDAAIDIAAMCPSRPRPRRSSPPLEDIAMTFISRHVKAVRLEHDDYQRPGIPRRQPDSPPAGTAPATRRCRCHADGAMRLHCLDVPMYDFLKRNNIDERACFIGVAGSARGTIAQPALLKVLHLPRARFLVGRYVT